MKKQTITIIITVAITVVLLTLGFFARSWYDGRQESAAQAAGTDFINFVVAGDRDAAYNLTTQELKDQLPKEDFDDILQSFETDEPNALEPSILRGNDRTLYVQYIDGFAPVGEGNTAAEFFLTMEKEGLDWKVDLVSIN